MVTKVMPKSPSGIKKIDKLIHEPNRLMIMAQLYVVESADFLFLQNQLKMTPGNLSSHLSKLEDAGYVEIVKEFIERKPHTALKLTEQGQQAFKNYKDNLKQVLDALPK
jgi:DNA-binding transcriptional ArsR family regulator